MAQASKLVLSGSTDGRGILVVATSSSGTLIHTGSATATVLDEVWLFAQLNNPFSAALTVSNKVLTTNVATITTLAAHGLFVGDTVKITGVDSTFNGTWSLATVPSTTTFTYTRTAANVGTAASGGTVYIKETAALQDVRLTIQWGGTTSPNDEITRYIPNQNGLYVLPPGLPLKGNATPLVIRAYADVASVVSIHGYVNRITG